jgi:hypothetical protein
MLGRPANHLCLRITARSKTQTKINHRVGPRFEAQATGRLLKLAPIGFGAGIGAVVGLLVSDFIIGLGVGAACYAVATKIAQSWTGGSDQDRNPPSGRRRQR